MHTFNKTKVIIAVIICLLTMLFVYRRGESYERTWEVLFSGLPVNITTAKASHNTLLYILKQTHEPLFRKDDGNNLTSRILLSWRRSVDSKDFVFCPDFNLGFSNKARFEEGFFLNYISSITAAYTPEFTVGRKDSCFNVRFKKSATTYLEFLTLYENAPTLWVSEQIEDGLGPFRAVSINTSQIVLVRKSPVGNGYNKIIVHDFKGSGDELLKNKNISDFNRVLSFDVPKWASGKYRSFDNIRLKSVILVINYPNKDVRKKIYNCLVVDSFKRAYFPNINGGFDIKNVFPLGVPGALPGKPAQSCNEDIIKSDVSVELANLRDDNHNELEIYSRDFQARTGIKIKVINYIPTELTKLRSRKTWAYNLLVMSADAVRPEQIAFLSPFLRKKPFIDYPLPALQKQYSEMLSVENPVRKSELSEILANGLAKEFVVLPLFQVTGKIYYPENIKNLEAGKGFLEYPEIAEFRL